MTTQSIRHLFDRWPHYNAALIVAVRDLTDEQLGFQPSTERWPLWATVGHLCCQRISGICGVGGEPGAETTPFPDALYRCPGDEYLEPSMNAAELVHALRSTFAVVEGVLDRWTIDTLSEEIHRDFGDGPVVRTRASIIQHAFTHDVYHVAEINEILARQDLPLVDMWS